MLGLIRYELLSAEECEFQLAPLEFGCLKLTGRTGSLGNLKLRRASAREVAAENLDRNCEFG